MSDSHIIASALNFILITNKFEAGNNTDDFILQKIINEGIGYMYNYCGLRWSDSPPLPDYCKINKEFLAKIAKEKNIKFCVVPSNFPKDFTKQDYQIIRTPRELITEPYLIEFLKE